MHWSTRTRGDFLAVIVELEPVEVVLAVIHEGVDLFLAGKQDSLNLHHKEALVDGKVLLVVCQLQADPAQSIHW